VENRALRFRVVISLFNKTSVSVIVIALTLSSIPAQAEERIASSKAPFYVGKSVMACGTVAQVSKTAGVTYINLDNAYPTQSLSLVVWSTDAAAYEARLGDLAALHAHTVCARGIITEYRNRLQIIMKNPQYLRLMSR